MTEQFGPEMIQTVMEILHGIYILVRDGDIGCSWESYRVPYDLCVLIGEF